MSRHTGAESGYEFLNDFELEDLEPYTRAPWLLNDFTEQKWLIQSTQKKPVEISWSVLLWDGSRLTDKKNDVLLRSLKHLVIIGANGLHQEFSNLAPASQWLKLGYTLRLVDYLLINARSYGLIEFGLGGLDGDSLKGILSHLASTPKSEDSIYIWKDRVTAFCHGEASKLSELEEQSFYKKYPSMLEVSDEDIESSEFNFELSDIAKLRGALMKAGVYYGENAHGFKVSTKELSKRLLADTVWGRQTPKSGLDLFAFYPHEKVYTREFPAVRVTTGEAKKLQNTIYFIYRYALVSSAILGTLGLPFPSDIGTIAEYVPQLGKPARFRSVPSANLLKLFRKSMEFHVDHGRKVLDGFIAVASYCQKNSILMSQLEENVFLKLIGADLVNMGVKELGLSSHRKTGKKEPRKDAQEDYYRKLRANHCLLELVFVYLGSIQLTVGTLMARRVDELVTLDAKGCLDESKSWLIFDLAKSTRKALGMRQRQSRPIDAIAVEMIEELRRFQGQLKTHGIIDDLTSLFATPSSLGRSGLQECNTHLYNRHLDFACDYFESDLNDAGERYYIRQHQLRRFFAIMFFYTNAFGELDTLRWMLGHRDVEHVWHYLTECMEPGDLRGAGARYFAELAKQDRLDNYGDLQDLLSAKFGTTSFKLVDEQRIEEYLEAMLEEGKARIKPQFYNDENGKSMTVLFIVS